MEQSFGLLMRMFLWNLNRTHHLSNTMEPLGLLERVALGTMKVVQIMRF